MKQKKDRRRGHNEGTICERADGRWVAVISLGYEGGKLKRKSYYGRTRAEVASRLNKALRDHQTGIPVVTKKQSLKEFLEHWLEHSVKPSVRPSTYASYETEVRVHIAPALGHVWLEKLSPGHLQSYISDKLQTDLSATTVAYHVSLIRKALNVALRWNLVQRNVALLVDKPRIEKHEITPITPEQAQTFLKAIKGDRLECFFSVALSLGLRRGEALGLRWQDIDFEARTLRVSQTLQRLNGELQISEPKTKGSRRVIALPDNLVSKLKEHRRQQLEEKLKVGEFWQDSGLVFTTSIGTPVDPRNVKRTLDRLLKAAGLPHFRIHDLRHFCASLLLAQGIPLKAISDLLGHTRISITGDLYAHVLPSLQRQTADIMDSLLTGAASS